MPIGARARFEGSTLRLTAYVGSVDGTSSVRMERSGPADAPQALGEALAAEMLAAGADAILAEVRGEAS